MTITLNGEPYHLDAPVSVTALLARLGIDSRRVAVEHNLVVVRRAQLETTMVGEGDQVEIVWSRRGEERTATVTLGTRPPN